MPRGTGQHNIYGGNSYVSHSKLQSPLTIQWLNENYEVADGVSLPRSALYSHYLDFCEKKKLGPVNAASFGKIIRHTFPNLKTRRLGTRGQSKYHYYGITIQSTSLYHDAVGHTARQSSTGFSQSYSKIEVEERTQSSCSHKVSHGGISSNATVVLGGTLLPDFPESDQLEFSDDIPQDKAKTFLIMYRAHCQRILDTILRANFGEVQNFLIHFWQGMPNHMLEVLECKEIVNLVGVCDTILYKAISGVLIPGPLQPLPASLTQAIRQFAVELSEWLSDSLSHLPAPLQEKKLSVAKFFSLSLRRQTSLTHLAQAARTVLHSAEPVSQMLIDWKEIDFECVVRQTLWTSSNDVTQDYEFTKKYYQEFYQLLEQQATIDQYAEWASSLVERCVKQQVKEDKTLEECSREFLQKWTFFSARITRELTLCSASSFGSFHLLHMLLEDYIMYTLENLNNAEEKYTTICRKTSPMEEMASRSAGVMEMDKTRTSCPRKSSVRRSSSTSSAGSLRSPRDPSRRYPAQSPRIPITYNDVSPRLMTSPNTPTNNNNNISKYPVPADQGHFIYPTPEMSPRYNTSAPSHMSPFNLFGTVRPPYTNSMGDFDMNHSYATDRYSNQDGGDGLPVRLKSNMTEPAHGMANNNNNLAYDYRNVPPTLVDHMKHYSQYPVPEHTYTPTYMYPPTPMPSNSLYPLQGISSGAPDKYYTDVLEEFVDMQAAVQHGQPNRPVRNEFSYASAILTS